jgi:5'-deoxynucleotidase YfbR-like HD superfamily hydrolase
MNTPLADLIKAGHDVTRWHTMRNLMPQNLASHAWGVAMILNRLHVGPAADHWMLITVALEHDLAESSIGDMPRPSRTQEHRELEARVAHEMGIRTERMLPPHLQKWLEWADLIEAGLHAQREVSLGNTNFNEILGRVSEHIRRNSETVPGPLFNFAQEAGLVL